MSNPVKGATARVASDLLEALAILSDNCQKICSWSRRLNGNENKGDISLGGQHFYYSKVFQRGYLPQKKD